jgi:hypothetical protein
VRGTNNLRGNLLCAARAIYRVLPLKYLSIICVLLHLRGHIPVLWSERDTYILGYQSEARFWKFGEQIPLTPFYIWKLYERVPTCVYGGSCMTVANILCHRQDSVSRNDSKATPSTSVCFTHSAIAPMCRAVAGSCIFGCW